MYHFEAEYCEMTCGKDDSGFEYTASHGSLVCHNHTWVTETFQAVTPICIAKPCQALYQSSLVQNAEINCAASDIINDGKDKLRLRNICLFSISRLLQRGDSVRSYKM